MATRAKSSTVSLHHVKRKKLGAAFERAIASIQNELVPEAIVTHDERLTDRHGHRRQFDVVIRGRLGGHDILGVIECKDLKGKVGTPAVEAFVTKTESLRADLKIIVSRFGFSTNALELGAHHGIRMLSLLKPDRETKGITVGNHLYARRLRWGGFRWGATRSDGSPFLVESSLEAATLNSIPIWDWLLKEVYTTYNTTTVAGWHSLKLRLNHPAELAVGGQSAEISAMEIWLRREVECYCTPALLQGRALIEFNSDRLLVPKGATLETNFSVDAEMKGWERVDEIPLNVSQPFPFVLDLSWRPSTLPEPRFSPDGVAEVTFSPVPPNMALKRDRRKRASPARPAP